METRMQLFRDWMAREERGTVWIAKKVGRTKAYISNILHGVWASIMAPATPCCYSATQKHLTTRRARSSRP
jgi:hypothetical protein